MGLKIGRMVLAGKLQSPGAWYAGGMQRVAMWLLLRDQCLRLVEAGDVGLGGCSAHGC